MARAPGASGARRWPDSAELALLGALAAISMWIVAVDLAHAAARGLVWTGTDGFFIVDQMQYLAWIQGAAHHLLSSNLFVLRPTPSDYLQPAIELSAALTALGMAPWLSLLLWKPVAVVAIFAASRAVVHRTLSARADRRAALALALAFGSFSVVYGSFGIVGDMMPTWLSWGYPFALLAVAALAWGLVRYERARARRGWEWGAGALGALASALHPWQGETMVLIILAAELWRWRDWRALAPAHRRRALALPATTLVLTGAPLLYYLLLGRLDASWALARDASKHGFSLGSIALAAAPLAIPALLGYRGRPRGFLELMLRLWAPVALVIWLFSASGLSATPLHAFNGITLPLSVLAVGGVRRSRLASLPRARALGALALALGTIPANAWAIATAGQFVDPAAGNANFIRPQESAALAFLARAPAAGGVLTQFYLGEAVPARTGRHTWVGDCLWSQPGCMPRSIAADALFEGADRPAAARAFVRASGARFLLSSCSPQDVPLASMLGSMVVSVRRFGCATVYEVAR